MFIILKQSDRFHATGLPCLPPQQLPGPAPPTHAQHHQPSARRRSGGSAAGDSDTPRNASHLFKPTPKQPRSIPHRGSVPDQRGCPGTPCAIPSRTPSPRVHRGARSEFGHHHVQISSPSVSPQRSRLCKQQPSPGKRSGQATPPESPDRVRQLRRQPPQGREKQGDDIGAHLHNQLSAQESLSFDTYIGCQPQIRDASISQFPDPFTAASGPARSHPQIPDRLLALARAVELLESDPSGVTAAPPGAAAATATSPPLPQEENHVLESANGNSSNTANCCDTPPLPPAAAWRLKHRLQQQQQQGHQQEQQQPVQRNVNSCCTRVEPAVTKSKCCGPARAATATAAAATAAPTESNPPPCLSDPASTCKLPSDLSQLPPQLTRDTTPVPSAADVVAAAPAAAMTHPSLVWQLDSMDGIAVTLGVCDGRVAAAARLAREGQSSGPWAVTCVARLQRLNTLVRAQELKTLLRDSQQRLSSSTRGGGSSISFLGALGMFLGLQRFLLQLLLLPPPVCMPVTGWASPALANIAKSTGQHSTQHSLTTSPQQGALESLFRLAVCLLDDVAKQPLFTAKAWFPVAPLSPATSVLCDIAAGLALRQAATYTSADAHNDTEVESSAAEVEPSVAEVEPSAEGTASSDSAVLLGWSVLQLASRVMAIRTASRISMAAGGPLCIEPPGGPGNGPPSCFGWDVTPMAIGPPSSSPRCLFEAVRTADLVLVDGSHGARLLAGVAALEAAEESGILVCNGGAARSQAMATAAASECAVQNMPKSSCCPAPRKVQECAGCTDLDPVCATLGSNSCVDVDPSRVVRRSASRVVPDLGLVCVVEGCCEGFQVDALEAIDDSLLVVASALLRTQCQPPRPFSANATARSGSRKLSNGPSSVSSNGQSKAAASALNRVLQAALGSGLPDGCTNMAGSGSGLPDGCTNVAGSGSGLPDGSGSGCTGEDDMEVLDLDDGAVAHAEQLAKVLKHLVGADNSVSCHISSSSIVKKRCCSRFSSPT